MSSSLPEKTDSYSCGVFNGIRIEDMGDVVRAFETNDTPTDVITLVGTQRFEVIDREAALAAAPEILQSYDIPAAARP